MEIPGYPATRPLDIRDKPLLDGIFHALQPRVSEFVFAGLYLFRSAHDYHVSLLEDALVVLGRGYDKGRYFLPPLSGTIPAALTALFSEGLELYGADEAFAARYLAGQGLHVAEDRDSFDYLYLREEMATLPGNRFHKKRNRIAYFSGRHDHQTEIYEKRHQAGCLALLEEWSRVQQDEGSLSSEFEVEATVEALTQCDALELSGVVVLVDDKIRAFALGERLNKETAVCHFEKSDPFLEGLPQLVNREFSRMLFGDCRYINREQDLGDQGLRRAKLSYHPLELVKKYRASRH